MNIYGTLVGIGFESWSQMAELNVDATFSLSNPVQMNVINFDVTFNKQNPLWNGRAQLFCAVIPSVNWNKLNQQNHY